MQLHESPLLQPEVLVARPNEPAFDPQPWVDPDGKLWISTMDGELVLVAARPDQFTELSRAQVIQTTRQSPVIASGRLYLRDNAEIVCFDIRKP